jgi:F0F1-type ATP synthase assembly protein I
MRGWRGSMLGIGLVIELTVILLVAVLVPLGLGIFLDRHLHTSPFITLFLMVVGISLGSVAVYRHVYSVYERVAGGKK